MADGLQAGYSITRQSVIAISFFVLNDGLVFFRVQFELSVAWALGLALIPAVSLMVTDEQRGCVYDIQVTVYVCGIDWWTV